MRLRSNGWVFIVVVVVVEWMGHLYTKVRVATKKKEKEKFFSPILL